MSNTDFFSADADAVSSGSFERWQKRGPGADAEARTTAGFIPGGGPGGNAAADAFEAQFEGRQRASTPAEERRAAAAKTKAANMARAANIKTESIGATVARDLEKFQDSVEEEKDRIARLVQGRPKREDEEDESELLAAQLNVLWGEGPGPAEDDDALEG